MTSNAAYWLAFVLMGIVACKEPSGQDEMFGLPHMELRADSQTLGELRTFGKLSDALKVKLIWNQTRFLADISLSGKSSENQIKRNYQVSLEDGTIKGLEDFRISSQGSDLSHLRFFVGLRVYEFLNLLVPTITPISFAINEEFAGLFHLIEPIDHEYFERRDLGLAKLYKAQFGRLGFADFSQKSLDDLQTGFDLKSGDDDYSDLVETIAALYSSDDPSLMKFSQRFDVSWYLRYLAVTVFLDHWDGFGNNYYLYRDNQKDDHKFRVIPWDLDKIYYGTSWTAQKSLWGNNILAKKLMAIPSYRSEYVALMKQLVSKFTVSALNQLVDQQAATIAAAFAADPLNQTYGITLDDQVKILKHHMETWVKPLDEELSQLPD